MSVTKNKSAVAVGFAAVALLGLSACSSDDASSTADSATSSMESMTSSAESSSSSTAANSSADPAANLVGSGCAGYAEQVPDGAGSVSGMAADPVAVAAGNNPLLTTLTAAVSGGLNPDVNLVDTLNGSEFTVIAPTDDAFAKIDPATIETLKTDSALLTSILTYHVIPGQLSPDEVAGEQTSVQGADVNITGEGESLKFNDSNLVCGGVTTANATVYMVDTVMMPPA
ncbi:MAG: fasciclin domain-containing protein [Rhodococcus sp. (in: high G+C Gram-positive bacteria)]